MSALDALRAAIERERECAEMRGEGACDKHTRATDAALSRVEAELAALRKRPTPEQMRSAISEAIFQSGSLMSQDERDALASRMIAIDALYGEAETPEAKP